MFYLIVQVVCVVHRFITLDGGSVLQMMNMTAAADDGGLYRCRATNSAKEWLSSEARLSVGVAG